MVGLFRNCYTKFLQLLIEMEMVLLRKMIDIHMHVVPDIDDGAVSMRMAEQMLVMAAAQGITDVFATSHSDYVREDTLEYQMKLELLQQFIADREIPIRVHEGCEVYCTDYNIESVIQWLDNKTIPTMNQTPYVLTEFWDASLEEVKMCTNRLMEAGYRPILAHIERYHQLPVEDFHELRDLGCLLQINAYSLGENVSQITRSRARALVDSHLVDVLGSDAHRTGHRPPLVADGLDYLYENCDKEFADAVAYGNAEKWLLGRE